MEKSSYDSLIFVPSGAPDGLDLGCEEKKENKDELPFISLVLQIIWFTKKRNPKTLPH